MKIISIANQKGGVGKTIVTFNLGYELSKSYRVLLIDMDPQCNLTSELVKSDTPPVYTILDLLNGNATIKQCTVKSSEGISYIAGSESLSFYDDEDATKLRKALRFLSSFDYVLIDNPPSINNVTLTSFTASEHVFIVTDTEKFSTNGIHKLMGNVQLIQSTHNKNLQVAGIIVNKMNNRRSMCKSAVRGLRRTHGSLVLTNVINNYSQLAISTDKQNPVSLEYPNSMSAAQFMLLAAEVKARV